jgi:predicted Rossmann-fold nucleotide-binding protein
MKSNDQQYLSVGRSLTDEIRDSHKTLADLWQGISLFANIKNCVTVYGSARFTEDHQYYQLARNMGRILAQNGFSVMTGGGPGVMEAANKLPSRPVVCTGRNYWQHMQSFLRETMLAAQTISPQDMDLAFLTDDPAEAVEYIGSKISGNEIIL